MCEAKKELCCHGLADIRKSYLKTQVPWENGHVIVRSEEIDAAIQAAYNVGWLDADFYRMQQP